MICSGYLQVKGCVSESYVHPQATPGFENISQYDIFSFRAAGCLSASASHRPADPPLDSVGEENIDFDDDVLVA